MPGPCGASSKGRGGQVLTYEKAFYFAGGESDWCGMLENGKIPPFPKHSLFIADQHVADQKPIKILC